MKLKLKGLLSGSPKLTGGSRFLRLALLSCLPALSYLSAAGHFERQVVEQDPPASLADRRAELEAKLATDPTNLGIRSKLLEIYCVPVQAGDRSAGEHHDTQLLWLIAHDPEASVLSLSILAQPARYLAAPFRPHYEEAEKLWINQLAAFPHSAAVSANASAFFHEKDAARAIDLIKRARQMDPKEARYVDALAWFYSQAEISNYLPPALRGQGLTGQGILDPALVESLHRELLSSTDAVLLAAVGSQLERTSLNGPLAETPLPAFGKQLSDRAVELAPAGPERREAMAAASLSQPTLNRLAVETGAARMGPGAMESSLTTKVDPVYPPLALQAGVQGIVVFNVLIDEDGAIKKAELVSGHPVLVDAAREALIQYRYRPTLLNGNPVPVVTQVSVRFRLPHDSK